MSRTPPSIAFIGWNPFQLMHILEVAQTLPNSCILLEKRKGYIYQFNKSLLTDINVPVVIWHRRRIEQLDGLFDVIVCQTPFSQMDKIRKSKIAMIQYGYAKEVHNYGRWRSAADLNIVYGEYAAQKIRPMCPVEIAGNPAFDKWHTDGFHAAAHALYGHLLDPKKKTVLYAPTWGDLSTTDQYLNEVTSLCDQYNVLLKIHHNTDFVEKRRRRQLTSGNPVFMGANDNLLSLLAVSDVVLSDYSGAIFDALYCRRPVVLLHGDIEKRIGKKLNLESLEYKARHRIGPVLETPGHLRQTLDGIFSGGIDFTELNGDLFNELFVTGEGAVKRVSEALQTLAGAR